MTLDSFLSFNKYCPVCGEKLTLCFQVNDESCWLGTELKDGSYMFSQHNLKEKNNVESLIALKKNNSKYQFEIHHNSEESLGNKWQAWQLYFLYICNPSGIDSEYNRTSFNMYDCCYFRSSQYMEFVKKDDGWELGYSSNHNPDIINRDEIFVFKKYTPDALEKVYYFNIDSEDQKTKLLYYASTEAERALEDFDPNIFETEAPPMPNRPDFSIQNRDRLIERFDSWIIMS